MANIEYGAIETRRKKRKSINIVIIWKKWQKML